MRQVILSGSVKAFYLDREKLLKKVGDVSTEASKVFHEIKEIRLFGSIARREETGLSDVDIFILIEESSLDPIERVRPYFAFFSERLDVAVDVIVSTENEYEGFKEMLDKSIILYRR